MSPKFNYQTGTCHIYDSYGNLLGSGSGLSIISDMKMPDLSNITENSSDEVIRRFNNNPIELAIDVIDITWKLLMKKLFPNNWLKMHGLPMQHYKRYPHEKKSRKKR